jgi:hypothetical protein
MPADQASPAPVSTSTPHSSSASSASSTSTISAFKVGFIALRFSGRFSSTQAMPASTSTFTVVHRSAYGTVVSFARVPAIYQAA